MRGVPPVPITDNGIGVFERATIGTYWERDPTESGNSILKTAAADTPRFNTEPGTGASVILLEPAATNLVGYSERADQWSLTGLTATSNALIAPDKNNSGDRLTEDTSTGGHYAQTTTATIPASEPFTAMICVRRIGSPYYRVEVRSENGTAATIAQSWKFSASHPVRGRVDTGGATAGTIRKNGVGPVASTWERVVIPNIVMPSNVTQVSIRVYAQQFANDAAFIANPTLTSYTGNGADYLAAWGADLKLGAANSSYYPTATSATATRAADVYGNMMVSNVPESEAVWNSGSTYAKGVRVRGNTTDTQHILFESLQGTNINHALTDTDWWFEVGPTNRWAPFDLDRSTGATSASPMYYAISPFELVDTAAFSNVVADRYTLEVKDGGGVTVFTASGELGDDPRSRVAFGLPEVDDATITLTLERDSGDVTLGSFDVGLSIYLGDTLEGAERSSLNFSRIERDPFGNLIRVKRRSVPTLMLTTMAKMEFLPGIARAETLSNAAVWLWFGVEASDHPYFEAGFIRGICRSFKYRMAVTTIQTDITVEEV